MTKEELKEQLHSAKHDLLVYRATKVEPCAFVLIYLLKFLKDLSIIYGNYENCGNLKNLKSMIFEVICIMLLAFIGDYIIDIAQHRINDTKKELEEIKMELDDIKTL